MLRAVGAAMTLAVLGGAVAGCDDDVVAATPDGGVPGDGGDAGAALAPFIEGPLVRYVDPFIGTGGLGFGGGSAYPGPALPHGMIHPGPDTSRDGHDYSLLHYSGYYYPDDEIIGFSHVRLQGTGTTDLGNILVMPTTGWKDAMASNQAYRSGFSHATEEASPGYYAVTLDAYDIRVELTTSLRAALHRYTFPKGAKRTILFDPTHFAGEDGEVREASAQLGADGRITGHMHYLGPMSGRGGGLRIYFAAELDQPITGSRTWSDGTVSDSDAFEGTSGGLTVDVGGDGDVVQLKIAVSFVDEAHGRDNLDREIPKWDFDGLRASAEATWEHTLRSIRVAGGSEGQRTIFYSALYRAFLMPTLFTEADGSYRGFDLEVHQAEGFTYYSDFSLWDTFRTLHPLMILIAPERARDFAKSLATMTAQGGSTPRWPLGTSYTGAMIGSPGAMVAAESQLKGIEDFDVDDLYAALKREATEPRPEGFVGDWRDEITPYLSLGYIPGDVSVTLEYAYADGALANLAVVLGRGDDARMFREHAGNWKNLWDKDVGFLRARDASGEFDPNFNPIAHDDHFVEGDSWQWTWYVPHDVPGLIEAFGSNEAFTDKLGVLFEESTTLAPVPGKPHHVVPDTHYWHSNEPGLHCAYMFADAGREDLTRKWVRHILRTQYLAAPDGLPGNDDGGTMSAWYVFSAMGFYPVAGTADYWLGAPIFERVRIAREDDDIEVRAPDVPKSLDEDFDVARVTWNAKPVVGRLRHEDIAPGGVLSFEARGKQPHEVP